MPSPRAACGRRNSLAAAISEEKDAIEDIYEPFVEGLKQAFSTFSPGDPSDPSTTLALLVAFLLRQADELLGGRRADDQPFRDFVVAHPARDQVSPLEHLDLVGGGHLLVPWCDLFDVALVNSCPDAGGQPV